MTTTMMMMMLKVKGQGQLYLLFSTYNQDTCN